MSQHNPNRFKSYPMTPETNHAGWIIGGVLVLILVLGLIAVMSRANPIASSDSQRSAATETPAKGSPAQ